MTVTRILFTLKNSNFLEKWCNPSCHAGTFRSRIGLTLTRHQDISTLHTCKSMKEAWPSVTAYSDQH